MAPKRKSVSLGRNPERDYPASDLFAHVTQAIADGANPFETIIFEQKTVGIETLTLKPRRSPPVTVHDTSGRIPDENTMAALTADAEILGIYPFDTPTTSPDS